MAEGLTLQPEHVRRMNEVIRWYERNRQPIEGAVRERGRHGGHILAAPFHLQIVECKTPQEPGGRCEAWLCYWHGVGEPQRSDTVVCVYDPLQVHHGVAPETGTRGTFWFVQKGTESGQWEIVSPVIEPAGDGEETTTTTSTTTTPPPCGGQCTWTWNAELLEWDLTENDCTEPTTTTTPEPTTTTTTTSEPTTTTTAEGPCGPWPTTTTSEPTTTTTQEPTTTTTPPGCYCLYPDFCGEADGEKTKTNCVRGAINSPPDCGQTTTTVTLDPCTTTTPPGCSEGCDWKWAAVPGGWVWVQLTNGCSAVCPCPSPSQPGTYNCEQAHTDCIVSPPPPPPPPCTGYCDWYSCYENSKWCLVYHSCGGHCGGGGDCLCQQPSREPAGCGDWERTPCLCYNDGTTTPDPCTTTTSTTTTTIDPCEHGQCKWIWSGYGWAKLSDQCAIECPCSAPMFDGTLAGQIAFTPCLAEITTTTTPEPTTTTTTEEPTTTTTPCVHTCGELPTPCHCCWQCDDGDWTLAQNGCGEFGCEDYGCEESAPGLPPVWLLATKPCNAGDCFHVEWPCSEATTTTTGDPGLCASHVQCTWQCQDQGWGLGWVPTINECPEGCECETPPNFPCGYLGQTSVEKCSGTMVTTTTTTYDPNCYCRYQCVGDPGNGQWINIEADCSGCEPKWCRDVPGVCTPGTFMISPCE